VPENLEDAERLIRDYIERYYNTKRRHSFIDFECPIEFELKSQLAAMAA